MTTISNVEAGRDVVITLARSSTASAFRGKIQAFLEEYLVSETGPVPFGGRDAELAKLDTWLSDDHAPPRLLITAPAGRGKSALLVRWITQLQASDVFSSDGWQLAFVPISIRAGTNSPSVFYQALARRLAEVADCDPGYPVAEPGTYYADQARDLLSNLAASGRRVLVVLDGIDEALRGEFDATVIPRMLPPTIRVLVSGRWQAGDADFSGWLGRLGWETGVRCETFELEVLDEAAIADVLVKMGAPVDEIASQPELVRRLNQLTEREPLLLRYYVQDLWQMGPGVARITHADLDNLRPGFGNYFRRWLEQQRKLWVDEGQSVEYQTVDGILAVLSVALGPLEADDVVGLAAEIHGAPRALSPQSILDPLRRFVFGDGSRKRGYVLSHPRIGYHLQNEHFSPRVTELTLKGFADWGRRTLRALNQGSLPPDKAPPYVLQFLCEHLQAVAAPPEDFMAMVENGWRLACESHGIGLQSFSSSVGAAWKSLQRDDAAPGDGVSPYLAPQIRCALVLSSLRSLGAHLSPNLLIAGYLHGLIGSARLLSLIPYLSLSEQLEVLEATADRLGPSLAENVLRHVETTQTVYGRLMVLSALYEHLPHHLKPHINDLYEAAETLDNPLLRATAFLRILPFSPASLRPTIVPRVLRAMTTLEHHLDLNSMLARLAPFLSPRTIQDTLDLIRSMGSPETRANAIVSVLLNVRQKYRRHIILDALEAVHTVAIFNRFLIRAKLAKCLPYNIRLVFQQHAINMIMSHDNAFWVAVQIREIMPYLSQTLVDTAIDMIISMDDEYCQSFCLAGILPYAPDQERSRLAGVSAAALERVSTGIFDEVRIERFIAELAPHASAETAQILLKIGRGVDDPYLRARVEGTVARFLPSGAWDMSLADSIDSAVSIGDVEERGLALKAVKSEVEKPLKQNLERTSSGGEPEKHDGNNTALHRHTANGVPPRVHLQAAISIGDPTEAAEALSALIAYAPAEEQVRIVREIVKRAPEIRRPNLFRCIAGMAPALERLGAKDALSKTIRSIEDVTSWFP